MNVRFADHSIRFRVTQLELDRLLSGRSVVLEVAMLRSRVFRANVSSSALSKWQLDSDPTGLWLTLPRTELENLSQAVPRKEGVGHDFESGDGKVQVSFEVDVRGPA
jgi:hypothetical protein